MIRRAIFVSTGPTQTRFHAMENKNMMAYLITMRLFFQFNHMVRMYFLSITYLLAFLQEMVLQINFYTNMVKGVKSN